MKNTREKKREYMREYMRARRQDPEFREKENERRRQRIAALSPEEKKIYAEKQRIAHKKWADENAWRREYMRALAYCRKNGYIMSPIVGDMETEEDILCKQANIMNC